MPDNRLLWAGVASVFALSWMWSAQHSTDLEKAREDIENHESEFYDMRERIDQLEAKVVRLEKVNPKVNAIPLPTPTPFNLEGVIDRLEKKRQRASVAPSK